jgi:hypothetical protein
MAAQEDVTTTRLTDRLHRAIQPRDATKAGAQKIAVRTKNDAMYAARYRRKIRMTYRYLRVLLRIPTVPDTASPTISMCTLARRDHEQW